MFMPYFVDSTGKKHTFPDDFALKGGLVRAWRRGESIFDYRYRLKSSYTGGHDYQLHSIPEPRRFHGSIFLRERNRWRELLLVILCPVSLPGHSVLYFSQRVQLFQHEMLNLNHETCKKEVIL